MEIENDGQRAANCQLIESGNNGQKVVVNRLPVHRHYPGHHCGNKIVVLNIVLILVDFGAADYMDSRKP